MTNRIDPQIQAALSHLERMSTKRDREKR